MLDNSGNIRDGRPFTVVWYCLPDDFVIFSRVYAEDANEAVVAAAQEHADGVWSPEEIQLLFVLPGHIRSCPIEAEDRFTFFSNGGVKEESQ